MSFKVKQKVSYTTQRGNKGTGVVKAVVPKVNGSFIHVSPDDDKTKLLKLRPAQVAAA